MTHEDEKFTVNGAARNLHTLQAVGAALFGKQEPPAPRTFTAEEVEPLVKAAKWALANGDFFFRPDRNVTVCCCECDGSSGDKADVIENISHKPNCEYAKHAEVLAIWDAKLSAGSAAPTGEGK